ncbi:YhdH/YhfP family quinone oxidoreductase [Thalassotalea maritima]|uniref:YhdH/YhfP family quinone oxidoreductase n=1 Tax=Thalassotalea maritima TaxID=3242416 RepID=UPI0035290652
MTDTFKALWVEETTDNKYLHSIKQRQLSDLPDNEVLIEVQYSSLNYKDALSAFGNKGVTKDYPHTPGIDAAGVVLSDTTGQFNQGDKVLVFGYDLGMNTPGGLAQRISVPANWIVPCPSSLTLKDAMIYGTGGLTAAMCIDKLILMGAKPNDGAVAVTGASGGVGSMTIAILHKLGFEIIAYTGKSDDAYLRQLGASEVLHRDQINEIGSKPMGRGLWAHAIDTLGGDYLANIVKQLKPGGGVSACGLAAGVNFQLNVFPFITRGVSLLGVDSVNIPLQQKRYFWQKVSDEYYLDNLASFSHCISLEEVLAILPKFLDGTVQGRYVVDLNKS